MKAKFDFSNYWTNSKFCKMKNVDKGIHIFQFLRLKCTHKQKKMAPEIKDVKGITKSVSKNLMKLEDYKENTHKIETDET